MDTVLKIEAHLNEIGFNSWGLDGDTFINFLRNSLINCKLLEINSVSDRVQFVTSSMFARSSEQLNEDDIIRKTEDQLMVDVIRASPRSTKWLVVRLEDESRLSTLRSIRDVIKNYEEQLTSKLPEFVPSMRWFAIGIPAIKLIEQSLGMKNHESKILVYWLNSFANDDQQQDKPSIKLTPREQEVLRWASEGKTSKDISIILGISDKTVNLHADNFISKLNASNRTNAVARAIRLNLI